MTEQSNELVRLQKVLAGAGVASRRASEGIIASGRVEVNGVLVTELGTRVNPAVDVIRVDGSRIPTARRHTYLVLNKPRGVVSTMSDPRGRENLQDYLPKGSPRLFHVGRLDTDTEGLILLTNDGEFTHRLTHPSWEIPKVYLAEVEGSITQATLRKLRAGVTLDDGPIKPDNAKLVTRTAHRTLIELTLHEGRNRIVRRLMDAVGHPVTRLSRTAIGPVQLGKLSLGGTRELSRQELGTLLDMVGL